MTQGTGPWQQPDRTSGWAQTTTDWLDRTVPPLAAAGSVLLFGALTMPTLVVAGVVGLGGIAGFGLVHRRNVWKRFQPPPGVDYRREDPELPSLLHDNDLGLEGLGIENSIRNLPGDLVYFQAVDRLGGRRNLVLFDLRGEGVTVSMSRWRPGHFLSRTPVALGLDLNGFNFLREPDALPTEQLYNFATERLSRALSTCRLTSWRMRGRYLVGRFEILSAIDPLSVVVRAADHLTRIRRAIPTQFITPLPETPGPGEDDGWPLFSPA